MTNSGFQGSNRKADLPSNWRRIKRETHIRDGWQCTYVSEDTGERCGYKSPPGAGDGRGLECDHVDDDKDHRRRNLRTLCWYHHRQKTSAQGGSKVRKKPKTPDVDRFGRRTKPHPGLRR